jgi:hypothetical protein
MFRSSVWKTRSTLTVAMISAAAISFCSVSIAAPSVGGAAISNASATLVGPRLTKHEFLGPLLAKDESSIVSVTRDGGVSVPLPNGKDLWVFGDTPRYRYQGGKWILMSFIHGSTAAVVSFKEGNRPTAPFQEIVLGRPILPNNHPTQFLPPPHTYLPDGSGKLCNQANGGIDAGAVRWATGAALLPDQTNVLITYIEGCVLNATNYSVQGWGFTEYNWKINKFDVGATDVFAPARNGAAISAARFMGSPIVSNDTVTLFSTTCCAPGSAYTTTIATDIAALRRPGSYTLHPLADVPATYLLSVSPPSASQPHLTMYWVNGPKGRYRIFTATNPLGPWTQTATDTLPRCRTPESPCTSINLHPELSSASRLLVSYYVPGYGPGIATHPFPHSPLDHLVWASIPLRS